MNVLNSDNHDRAFLEGIHLIQVWLYSTAEKKDIENHKTD